jgi:hypothetical protein
MPQEVSNAFTGAPTQGWENQFFTDLGNTIGHLVAMDADLAEGLAKAAGYPNNILVDKGIGDVVSGDFQALAHTFQTGADAMIGGAFEILNGLDDQNFILKNPSLIINPDSSIPASSLPISLPSNLGETAVDDPTAVSDAAGEPPDEGDVSASIGTLQSVSTAAALTPTDPTVQNLDAVARELNHGLDYQGATDNQGFTVTSDGRLFFNGATRVAVNINGNNLDIAQQLDSHGGYKVTAETIGADMANVYMSFINDHSATHGGSKEIVKLTEDLSQYSATPNDTTTMAFDIAYGLDGDMDLSSSGPVAALAKLGSVENFDSHPRRNVIQALDGTICLDRRPVGEDGTALPGQTGRSGPQRRE